MLTFDAIKHEYREDGRLLLNVTKVLELNDLYKGTDYMLPEHRERGKAVHLSCEYWDKGVFDDYEWDPVVLPYVEAWKEFKNATGFNPVLIEQQLSSRIYGFAGTVDRVGIIDGDGWIIDIKTGTDQKCSRYQTAAYQILVGESGMIVELAPKRVCRGTVELKPDGTYKLHPHNKPENRNDMQRFIALLVATQVRMEFGVL